MKKQHIMRLLFDQTLEILLREENNVKSKLQLSYNFVRFAFALTVIFLVIQIINITAITMTYSSIILSINSLIPKQKRHCLHGPPLTEQPNRFPNHSVL